MLRRLALIAEDPLRRILPAPLFAALRSAWWALRLSPLGDSAQTYPGIPGRVHENDEMLGENYAAVGISAIQNIRAGLEAVGRDFSDVRSVLDLPSGYGRVLRWMVKEIPPSRITASDIKVQAIEFCAKEFGVKAFPSRHDFDITFPERYDLIWVGSLITHTNNQDTRTLLRSLTRALALDGLLVFTTIGPEHLDELSRYGQEFSSHERLLRKQMESGYAFINYAGQPRLGTAFHAPGHVDRLLEEIGLCRVLYRHRGWADDQDVWAAIPDPNGPDLAGDVAGDLEGLNPREGQDSATARALSLTTVQSLP